MHNSFVKVKVKKQDYLGKRANVIFMSDVTKKVHSRINEVALEEVAQQAQLSENFTQTVSHEMKTPLASILFFVKALQRLVNEVFKDNPV